MVRMPGSLFESGTLFLLDQQISSSTCFSLQTLTRVSVNTQGAGFMDGEAEVIMLRSMTPAGFF